MWTRESCDFPDDDLRLSRVSRVSLRLWKSRIGVVLRPFFMMDSGSLISNRLRREATYVERYCKEQSSRKKGKKPGNPLEDNDTDATTDATTDIPMDSPTVQPTQVPQVPQVKKEQQQPHEASPIDQKIRERLLASMGADPISGMIGPNGTRLGSVKDMAEVRKWTDLKLSTDDQCRLISERCQRQQASDPGWQPRSFGYFTGAMADFAASRSRPVPSGNAGPTASDKAGELDRLMRNVDQFDRLEREQNERVAQQQRDKAERIARLAKAGGQ